MITVIGTAVVDIVVVAILVTIFVVGIDVVGTVDIIVVVKIEVVRSVDRSEGTLGWEHRRNRMLCYQIEIRLFLLLGPFPSAGEGKQCAQRSSMARGHG